MRAAQQAVAADTLVEDFVEVGFGFESFQFLMGTSFHPRAAEPRSVMRLSLTRCTIEKGR